MTDETTNENRTAQQIALLIIFGGLFSTTGMTVGVSDSYGVLSWIFLGLGVLTLFVAVVLAVGEDDALGEDQTA